MKVLQLVGLLEDVERKWLTEAPQIQGRESALKAVRFLYKCVDADKDFDKEAAVKAILKSEYSTKNWNHLRQLFHIISQSIEDILVKRQVEAWRKDNPMFDKLFYLYTLINRKQWDLFDKEYQKTVGDGFQIIPFQLFMAETGMKMIQHTRNTLKPRSEKNAQASVDEMQEVFDAFGLQTARMMAEFNFHLAMHQRKLFEMQSSDNELEAMPASDKAMDSIRLIDYSDDLFVRFNQLSQEALFVAQAKRIQILLEVEALLVSPELSHPWFEPKLLDTYGQLAHAYENEADYEKADEYYRKSMDHWMYPRMLEKGMYEHLHIRMQWKAGHFNETIALYEKYRPIVKDTQGAPEIRTYVAASHLMLDDIEACKKLVLENSRLSDFKIISDRLLLAICFYYEGSFDLMERELENILQLMKTREYSDHELHRTSTRQLINFSKAMQLPDGAKRKKQLLKLKNELGAKDGTLKNKAGYTIVYAWLSKVL